MILLVGIPLWWVLGLVTFIFPILAVPMAWELRRRRPIRYPPLFWLWALFMLWQFLSLAMFNASPPGEHTTPTGGRLLSIGIELFEYGGITVTLLYIGNLTLKEVSQRDIGRWMGWFFVVVVGGGFLGLVAPRLQFHSALELFLPRHVTASPYVAALVHPVAAQVQDVTGQANGRPSAPFGYTNSWGNTLGELIMFFVAVWVIPARSWRRVLYAGFVAIAFIPILFSLNRGLWIGLICTAIWFGGRQVAHGKLGALAAGIAIAAVSAVVFVITPAHTVVEARLNHQNSNSIRSFVAQMSLTALEHSPVIGYGGTRHSIGSAQSIAIGKSASCAKCGDVSSGSTGQFWSVSFNQGFGGIIFFFGFFMGSLWVYRRERTPIDEAALAAVAVSFVYSFFYGTMPVAPTLIMIAVAVLWRSRDARLGLLTDADGG